MICHYIQSEGRNITVIAKGDYLIVIVDGQGYMIDRPDHPNHTKKVQTVEILESDTINIVLEKVGATWQKRLEAIKKEIGI